MTAGDGQRTILLHGFPQTWWKWRLLIPPLVEAGFRVVAPDYRGAGQSSRPLDGMTKRTTAKDVHRLVRDHLRVGGPLDIVGHDIGLMMMIGYAYAQVYREEVAHLVILDAPIPRTSVFERVRSNPRVWHFASHSARDVAEVLVAGREREYLQAFFYARTFDPSAICLETYISAYSAPGATRRLRALPRVRTGRRRQIERLFSARAN